MDIQPVCSMRILKYIGKDKEAEWTSHFLKEGFAGKELIIDPIDGIYPGPPLLLSVNLNKSRYLVFFFFSG
jgi:maleylacetoacetate isomerase